MRSMVSNYRISTAGSLPVYCQLFVSGCGRSSRLAVRATLEAFRTVGRFGWLRIVCVLLIEDPLRYGCDRGIFRQHSEHQDVIRWGWVHALIMPTDAPIPAKPTRETRGLQADTRTTFRPRRHSQATDRAAIRERPKPRRREISTSGSGRQVALRP